MRDQNALTRRRWFTEYSPSNPGILLVIPMHMISAMRRGKYARGENSFISVYLTLMVTASIAAAAPPHYRAEFLPVPEGCQSLSQLHGLGEQDRIVGVISCDSFATQRAVIWDHGVLTELGTFGGPNSEPYGLSPQGAVVGFAETPEIYEDEYHVARPFLWTNGKMHDLGTLGGSLGGATAINSKGEVVGACQPADVDFRIGRRPFRACLWEGETVQDIGDLGGPEVYGYDINNRGWIVGDANTADLFPSGSGFEDHAFLYDGQTMHDLGTLGGPASLAFSVNNRGEVVGFSYSAEISPHGHPAIHAFRWRDGQMTDLGTLGESTSWAADINNSGRVVGWSWLPLPGGIFDQRAVLWDGDTIADLNGLVEGLDGWTVREAWAIDDEGRILANADKEWQRRLVLLIPTSGIWASLPEQR